MDITAKDSLKNMLAKRTSAIITIRQQNSFTLGGGGETKNNKLLTSYQVIITTNNSIYIEGHFVQSASATHNIHNSTEPEKYKI